MDLQDAVALSIWPEFSRPRVAEALRVRATAPSAHTDRHAPARDEPVLEELLREAHPAADVPALVRMARVEADTLLARARRAGIAAIGWAEARYPAALAAIFDPPPVLWVLGRIESVAKPSVAIVGSRAASPYALEVAERLGNELAARGVTVVSGLARGVDSAAHRGALDAGGETVAVFGSGVDVVYPSEHRNLAGRIVRQGSVVSELPPGTPPRPHHFPLRNRIISGLSLAVVVVEASDRSGSLITARAALEQGREVMAVPGNVLTGRNRGSHALLKDGAKIVESADDILEELPLLEASPAPARVATAPDDAVLRVMGEGEAYDLDTLAEQSGIDMTKLLPRLVELELRGAVERIGGGRFVRGRRTC